MGSMQNAVAGTAAFLAEFEERRVHVQARIKRSIPADLRGSFLHVACGAGNGLVAALQAGFQCVVGVDPSDKPSFRSHPGRFPALCRQYAVDPARVSFFDSDRFQTGLVRPSFDVVCMLDSLNHLPNPRAMLEMGALSVRPGGCLVIDTCPLYFGRAGHHLLDHLPATCFPGAHAGKHFGGSIDEHGLVAPIRHLHRANHDNVRNWVRDSGLEITQDECRSPTANEIELLDAYRPALDLNGIDARLLVQDWFLVVARRPQSPIGDPW